MPAYELLLWAAVVAYGVAAALYSAFLLGLSQRTAVVARFAIGIGFLLHTAQVATRGIAGMHPASSAGDAVGFVGWLLAGAFLVAQVRRRLDAVGAFVAPCAIVLLLVVHVSPDPTAAAGLGPLLRVHISLATFGVAIFALATGLAVFYLAQERQLKQRRVGAIVKKGIALETLDTLSHRCVQVGFPIFTIAMVLGAIWAARTHAGVRPEYPIAGVTWLSFAALLIARTTSGWRGRRAALLTLVGFVASIVVLGIYVARRLGGA